MNLCSHDQKSMDNYLKITKNISKIIDKRTKRKRTFGSVINYWKKFFLMFIYFKTLQVYFKILTNENENYTLKNESKAITNYETLFNKKVSQWLDIKSKMTMVGI